MFNDCKTTSSLCCFGIEKANRYVNITTPITPAIKPRELSFFISMFSSSIKTSADISEIVSSTTIAKSSVDSSSSSFSSSDVVTGSSIDEPVTTSDEEKEEEEESTEDLAIVVEETISEMSAEVLIEEENIEIKKESSLGFIAGVIGVVIFTYLFAFSIPKQQSEEVVLQSLNNSVRVSEEILEGAIVYNQLNCQSCHTQNVRILIPDSQNGKILKNRFANKNLIQNTGLLRLAPDLSTLGTREPTNDAEWLKEYLIDPSSVKEDIPHPSVNFLSNQDLDYLITYLLSLGSTNE